MALEHEVEHRGLEVFGARAGEMRGTFEGPGGWAALLQAFAQAAAAPSA